MYVFDKFASFGKKFTIIEGHLTSLYVMSYHVFENAFRILRLFRNLKLYSALVLDIMAD